MKVVVIVKASKASEAGKMPTRELLAAMGEFNEALADAGVLLAGEGLRPSSAGVRVRFSGRERTVVRGPFEPAAELIAGFWLWKVASMDEAIAWARRCPSPHEDDGEIEIRPVFEAADFGETLSPELREQEAGIRAQALGLGRPRFEDLPERSIAGVNATYTFESRPTIPQQWECFVPRLSDIPGQVDSATYGVCWNYRAGAGFDYLTGVEVADADNLPGDFTCIRLPAQRYAVFPFHDHVSTIPAAMEAIWTQWAPESGLGIADAPCFERYSRQFNPQTGKGGIEIWIPLKR